MSAVLGGNDAILWMLLNIGCNPSLENGLRQTAVTLSQLQYGANHEIVKTMNYAVEVWSKQADAYKTEPAAYYVNKEDLELIIAPWASDQFND